MNPSRTVSWDKGSDAIQVLEGCNDRKHWCTGINVEALDGKGAVRLHIFAAAGKGVVERVNVPIEKVDELVDALIFAKAEVAKQCYAGKQMTQLQGKRWKFIDPDTGEERYTGEYILAQVGYDNYRFISLLDGNRLFDDPISSGVDIDRILGERRIVIQEASK